MKVLAPFLEIPFDTWVLAAISVVILGVICSAKYVLIALLARWVGRGWRK